ncbi:MAG: putative zinc protease [Gemmatimonadetes bacterium]|nr:putative zinc protease [Gemmatimonadota bacterium]
MSRRIIHASLTLAVTLAVTLACSAGAQSPTKAPAPGPVKPAALPAFQEATLPNGLRIMLVESRRQPVVSIALMMPAGEAYDPGGKEGLASMVASVLTKGAGARSADQMSSAIEGVGGSIDASASEDFMNVRANVLAENAPLAFELVADAAIRPSFETKELELVRTQALSALQLAQSNPAILAQHFFAAQLYGGHPYGKHATATSVNAITSDDVRGFQRSRLVPAGALLVIAGDISLAKVKELAQKNFGSWAGKASAAAKRPSPPTRSKTEILLVHRPGSVQSNILVGNLTYAPTSPSYYALTVASRILGGGSDGRLFKTLREQKSWTYGAYSDLVRNRDIGTFEATAEVRNAVTDSALTELLKIERDLGTTAVDATELDAARGGLVGSIPLQLETAQGIAEQVGRYTMLGLPGDFIRTLRPRLAAVSAPQVLAAAKSYMRADQSLIVVVGDGAQIYEKLAKIAPTKIVNAQGDAMSPADLIPRVTALPVDITKLVARSDSFTVMVQGNPLGFQTQSLTKTESGYSYHEVTQIGPFLQQDVVVLFGNDLSPVSVKGMGKVQGNAMNVDVSFANGRAKGSSTTPSPTGMRTVMVDTTMAPGVLESDMVAVMVPALRWAPNAKFTVSSFDASSGATRQTTMAVVKTESITVPAGTFSAYRVEITGGEQTQTIFISATAPYRVLKIALTGQPVEFVLVK